MHTNKVDDSVTKDTATQIGTYVISAFEDADGNMWFARGGYGACKFNRASFAFFLKKDGLYSNHVPDIKLPVNHAK